MMNLRLLGCRLSEECISNVHRFLYDPNALLQLPFKDDCVDVVILNGVLEWIGSNDMPDFPERIQSAALKEIWRILKPGGTLYIGIENRYSLSVLRGARLHGELPFVGLMPRWLANAITHLVTGKSHRTYIYSLSGYRRLLGKAGFHIVEFFWPYPSYHNPNYLIPLKPGWAKRFWLESLMVSRSRKFRLTRFLGLGWLPFHWLAFSYSIRCQK
jgi:SAM-dependent methyltransferase